MNLEFSVLMSLYVKESASNFKSAIDSVLNQRLLPSEIVIVLDGPLTEDLYDILDVYKKNDTIKVIPLEKNGGLGPALNEGLKHCSYNLVARMDTDDICVYDRFYEQVSFFSKNQEYTIVGGNVGEFISDHNTIESRRVVPETNKEILSYSRTRNPFNHPTVMYKKDEILKLGGYHDVPFFEDYDLWTRLLNTGYLGYNIQKNIVLMRTEPNLFRRRGGFSYVKNIYNFRRKTYKSNFSSFYDFIYGILPHTIVALLPNKVREYIYRKILRD